MSNTNVTLAPCQLQPGAMCEVKAPRDVNLMDRFVEGRIDINPAYAIMLVVTLAVAIVLGVAYRKARADRKALRDEQDAYSKRRQASKATIAVGMQVSGS